MGEEGEECFNAANFWRAPLGPPPAVCDKPQADSTTLPPAPPPASPQPPAEAAPASAPPDAGASGQLDADEMNRRIRKVDRMLKPTPVAELTTDEIKARLTRFETEFRERYRRPIALSDCKDMPQPVLDMYNEIGRRLTPEQRAEAEERLKAKQAAAKQVAAEEEEKRAAAAAVRAKEWETFEANKDALWREASSAARDQRSEVAAAHGLSERTLSGAATFVRDVDEGEPKRNPTLNPTREEFIEQKRLERGLSARPGEPTEEEKQRELDEFAAKGGAAADAVAQAEAWTKRMGADEPPKSSSNAPARGQKPLVEVLGPCNNRHRSGSQRSFSEPVVVVSAAAKPSTIRVE